ncbi:matrixin family metalloprotease [Puniceibacterium confluentis]|uniref:matrixin family metalloprotease n=1 Tax=Puniceibacterium confluentis TaxID=1958944 RepID=UPI0011B7ED17|nr:matrixin family metalloprotease [Puniceibacterium confluentis]
MTIPAPPDLSTDLLSLLDSEVNRRWNGAEPHGTPVVVSYSFLDAVPAYSPDIPGFEPFGAEYHDIIRGALDVWDDASGITFVEVPVGVSAEITFGMRDMTGLTNANGNPTSGYSSRPLVYSTLSADGLICYNRQEDTRGDVWMNAEYYGDSPASMAPGVRGYSILLHEIGHAIGLKHPFSGDVTINPFRDNGSYTVMSYDRPRSTVSLGSLDIQATRVLYGPDLPQNVTWDPVQSALVQIAPDGGGALFAQPSSDILTGSGGDDRFHGLGAGDSATGGAGDDLASLNMFSWGVTASLEGETYVLALDDGTVRLNGVERVQFLDRTVDAAELLGPGEVIEGTSLADNLTGTDRSDSLYGFAGDDTLSGGHGNDHLEGGDGHDMLIGDAGNDRLVGGPGNDVISGGDGGDLLEGDLGADVLAAGPGNDTISGGDDDDMIGGGTGDDLIHGGDGADTIGSGGGNDTADGGLGDDIVNGGPGDDSTSGGAGNDTMGASFGNDTVTGEDGDDSLGGGTGRDMLQGSAGNDDLGGGEGDDHVAGGIGDDFLAGGGRNDVVIGGAGNDVLNGGSGDDTLTGGIGADLFVFNSFVASEVDLITDFEDGIDTFRMTGIDSAPGAGLQGRVDALNITDVVIDGQEGVTMTYRGHVVTVIGVAAAGLGTEDFVFV